MRILNSHIVKSFFLVLFVFVSHTINAQTVSDVDKKETVKPLENSLGYIALLQPQVIENAGENTQYGFIADDVKKVFPGIVKNEKKFVPAGKNNYRVVTVKNTDLQSLIPVLVGSVKEQQAEIEKLKKELAALKAK
jgi:hypothetical protein